MVVRLSPEGLSIDGFPDYWPSVLRYPNCMLGKTACSARMSLGVRNYQHRVQLSLVPSPALNSVP
jgi:hypothetical protein